MPPRRRRTSQPDPATGNATATGNDSSSTGNDQTDDNNTDDNNTSNSTTSDSGDNQQAKNDTSTGSSEELLNDGAGGDGNNGGDQPLTREQLEAAQVEIKREHEQLYVKYKEERQRLINKEIELTEQGTMVRCCNKQLCLEKHPKIEKEIEQLQEDRQKRLNFSERQFDYTVATITEQYESKRQQIDSDYKVPNTV